MISSMNFLVRWYIKRFNKELDEVRYKAPSLQLEQLKSILKNTLVQYMNPWIGTDSEVDDWKKNAPLTDYQDYTVAVDTLMESKQLKVEYYAQSSGTTRNQKKLIPTPESFVRSNHLRGSWYILNTLYNNHSAMNVFVAKNLLIGGAIYKRTKDYSIGDVSGIMINRIPSFFRPFYVPTIAESISPNWEEKIEITAQKAIHESQISLVGGVPTWVLATFRKIIKYSGVEKVTDLWPDMKAYIHGGVSIEPYINQFKELIDTEDFMFIEVYNATEGFFAVQDDPSKPGMLLMTKSGIYFEFIPLDKYHRDDREKYIMNLSDVTVGQDYVILITTLTGLMRYQQGDIVRFVSTVPPRVKVVGRISEYINAFGEDLLISQAEESLLAVSERHQVSIAHYTVGPKYLTIDQNGRHEWYIEFKNEPDDIVTFTDDLDRAIMEANSNYKQKRTAEIAIASLSVTPVPLGTFQKYLKLKGKLGGQSKVKKLSNDRTIIDGLRTLIEENNG